MCSTGLKRLAAALALSCCASAALAQYVWLDGKGVKQYSDMPPPASVPNGKILKSPGMASRSTAAAAAESMEKDSDTTKKGPETIAEKNADFQKRRMQQAEKDKEAEQKTKQAADKKNNCDRANTYNRVLESGQRVTRMDQSGERAYLTDEERAQEIRENKRTLADCK